MIIIFTGNGKGKTTAALGQALRAAGNGSRVLMVQFIKGPWKSGEDESAKLLGNRVKIEKMGKGFVGTLCDKLSFEEHAAAATRALKHAAAEAKSGNWDLLILDEIWVALSLNLLSRESVESFVRQSGDRCQHLIMTGRGCPPAFFDMADLVTEMREVKHPFSKGVKAVTSIEY